jgi:hypothetical protein
VEAVADIGASFEGGGLSAASGLASVSLSLLLLLPAMLLSELLLLLLELLDSSLAERETSRLACFAHWNRRACFAALPPRLMDGGILLPCLAS